MRSGPSLCTGAGERAFCAGADLKERRGLSAPERADHTARIEAAAEALAALPMPTVAAIRGYALAGGAELASPATSASPPPTPSGISGGEDRHLSWRGRGLRLAGRIVGDGAARDLLFTGRQVRPRRHFASVSSTAWLRPKTSWTAARSWRRRSPRTRRWRYGQ